MIFFDKKRGFIEGSERYYKEIGTRSKREGFDDAWNLKIERVKLRFRIGGLKGEICEVKM